MDQTVSYEEHREFLRAAFLGANAELLGFIDAGGDGTCKDWFDPTYKSRYEQGFRDGQAMLMEAGTAPPAGNVPLKPESELPYAN